MKSGIHRGTYQPLQRSKIRPSFDPAVLSSIEDPATSTAMTVLWDDYISVDGPDFPTIIGAAYSSRTDRMFELYHVVPVVRVGNRTKVHRLLQNLADFFDGSEGMKICKLGMLIFVEPKSGHVVWAGIAREPLSAKDIDQFVTEQLGEFTGDNSFFWAPVRYST
ncbi:MAG: hypothetical protein AAF583_06600 [Pseudomonadota bacterium]